MCEMPIFNNFINKLSQVSSELNHELGKAKESLVFETGNYLGSSIIRSESTRFSSILGSKATTPPSLPKSTSMPTIQGIMSQDRVRKRNSNVGSKYKYRSSYCEDSEGDLALSPSDVIDEDSIVNKFLKVVGDEDSPRKQVVEEKVKPVVRSTSLNSREDIRKKLASFGEEETIVEEEDEQVQNKDLEICFINETASDDEDENVMVNPLRDTQEGANSNNSLSNQNFETSNNIPNNNIIYDEEFEEEKWKIQSQAKASLSQCKSIARRQLLMEKQKRLAEDPLKKLLGITSHEVSKEKLDNYNINTLQVILNDFQEKIEQHSTELVNLLMQKDELQTEQESMLIDIEDISHSHQ